jgi:Bax protein
LYTYRIASVLTIIVLLLATACERRKTYSIVTEIVKAESPEQILLINGPLVKPVLYTHVSGLEKLPARQAKVAFISAVLPSILVAKHHIEQRRLAVIALRDKAPWERQDSALYVDMRDRYRAKDIDDLILRLAPMPTSIVLAQAAVESGWGKSRFFLTANNLFGVWSFNKRESRVAARRTRENKKIYLRAYPDMSQSIVDYFEILARSRSYKNLRKARHETSDPFEILPHLKNFSERRLLYTNQLKKVIVRNNLTRFDSYTIDPQYIVEED